MFRVRLAVQGVYKRNYVSDNPPNIKNSVMTLPKYRRYLKPVDPKLEEKYASARVEQGWSREWAEAESRESDKLSLLENDNYGNNKHNLFRMVSNHAMYQYLLFTTSCKSVLRRNLQLAH